MRTVVYRIAALAPILAFVISNVGLSIAPRIFLTILLFGLPIVLITSAIALSIVSSRPSAVSARIGHWIFGVLVWGPAILFALMITGSSACFLAPLGLATVNPGDCAGWGFGYWFLMLPLMLVVGIGYTGFLLMNWRMWHREPLPA